VLIDASIDLRRTNGSKFDEGGNHGCRIVDLEASAWAHAGRPQKLFGWFGGYGPKGTGGFLENLGFRPGLFFAVIAGLGEITGGMLTAAGLVSPVDPALIILVMLVAVVTAHWEYGFFAASNGIELPLLYMTAALALDVTGPGRYSLDGLFGLRTQPQAVVAWSAIAIAVVMALANVAVRPRPNHVQTHA
jgi:putative oxidoreductase